MTTKNKVTIRKATTEDAKSIRYVQYTTWLATYPNEKYNVTTEDIKNKEMLSEESINKTRKYISGTGEPTNYVVELDDKIVGWGSVSKNDEIIF